MKAIALILLGAILAAASGLQFIQRDDISGTALGALCFLGLIAGFALTLWGLIANHHDHTRRR